MMTTMSMRNALLVSQPLLPSVFPQPYVSPVEKFFDDYWRVILDGILFVASIALIPLTAGLSTGLALGIQVGFDLVSAGIDTAIDALQDRDLNSSTLLNFIPVVASAGLGLAFKGAAKFLKGIYKAVPVLANGALELQDDGPSFLFKFTQQIKTDIGVADFKVNKAVIDLSDTGTLRNVLKTGFRDQVYASESFSKITTPATVGRYGEKIPEKVEYLSSASFLNQSDFLEMEIDRRVGEYVKQFTDLKRDIRLFAIARKVGAFDTPTQKLIKNIVKNYKLVKKTIARIKLIFDLPSRAIKAALKLPRRLLFKKSRNRLLARYVGHFFKGEKRIRILKRLGAYEDHASRARGIVRAKRSRVLLERASTYGRKILRELNLIPVNSDWILGFKIIPKRFGMSPAEVAALNAIVTQNDIPNDPTWMADVWVIFDPVETRHDGELAGMPHARWGIVGPPEKGGKRPQKILMNGEQINDILFSAASFSFGRWYLNEGRNMARESKWSLLRNLLKQEVQGGSILNPRLARFYKAYNFGVHTIREALYWKMQVQFVYARVKQIQDGSFFSRMLNPQKWINVAAKIGLGELIKKQSLGNTLFRAGYAIARNDRRGLRLITQHQIRSNKSYSRLFKRVREGVNTGRRLSAKNAYKLTYASRKSARSAIRSPFQVKKG